MLDFNILKFSLQVKKSEIKLGPNYQSEDPDYAVWVPPGSKILHPISINQKFKWFPKSSYMYIKFNLQLPHNYWGFFFKIMKCWKHDVPFFLTGTFNLTFVFKMTVHVSCF